MSCHTWCAYKSQRTIEEARRLFILEHEKTIKLWNHLLNNPKEERSSQWTDDFIKERIEVFERQLRMVKKGLCNVAVMKKQPEVSYYFEGKGFFIDSKEHGNQFRIRTYPEDYLFSKEECMAFIEKNKDKIEFFDTTYEELDEFWDRYPDGMMSFG